MTRVTVADGYQVVVGADVHLAGESVEVDAEQAERWAAAGWVTVEDKPRRPARRPAKDRG